MGRDAAGRGRELRASHRARGTGGQGRIGRVARQYGEGEGLVLPAGQEAAAKDTRDFEKGGNCVWYDEPDLLKKVEAKLGQKVPTMDAADLTFPPELRDVVFGEVRE